jgi:hypothetical protein
MNIPEWLGDEEEAMLQASNIGRSHGYGNVIAHLMREWQLLLMEHGLSEDAAREAVMNREPYPLEFHRPATKR